LVEKWILPSRSKTAEIGQKIDGILGVNCQLLSKNGQNFTKRSFYIWIEMLFWAKLCPF
jgi:hypothetical protein